MFSFHKPRVYRSTEGCCICRAKSSSSRFTDSRKYEDDSMKCFNLKQPRHGEICNACVLLVKRYKRLPAGSNRNWGHVVDARAGPGTKSLTKTKRGGKDDSEPSSDRGGSTSSGSSNVTRQTQNTKSLLQEKFSKIFKKTKKVKVTNGGSSSSGASGNGNSSVTTKKEMNKRRSNSNGNSKSWRDNDSLPTTPDSLDSDYEESRLTMAASSNNGATTVQFQTQTRASSYRSRKNAITTTAPVSTLRPKLKQLPKLGSKRRKILPPQKNRNPNKNVQFFDESEWQEKKSCCGTVYESIAMTGAVIIDWEHYKPCMVHRRMIKEKETATQSPKPSIIATMPAIVQLAPPPAIPIPNATATSASTPAPAPTTSVPVSITVSNSKPTPALKKHHLFFKRQSESFPQADPVSVNYNSNIAIASSSASSSVNTTKFLSNNNNISNINSTTIVTTSQPQQQQQHQHQQHQLQQPLQINSIGNCPSSTTIVSSSGVTYTCNGVQLPKHSTAKITTITPGIVPTSSSGQQLSRQQHNLLHKVKTTDAGKIIKHSLEKINTNAMRTKSNEISLIKSVDKSYMLARPSVATITTINHQQQQHHQQHMQQQLLMPQQPHMPITIGAYTAGCSPSSTSSSSTKFSDNSSDSGFDENMQDRKSVSPLQDDTERKLVTRPNPGVQTMFLASGVQIQGQQQNLVLTGNEVAAKILNNRKQQPTTISVHQQRNNRLNVAGPATASVKIAQIVAGTSVNVANGAVVSGSHTKMRTIYNNNTIQHENGVTTIVPASSLAATTQTAAMNAIAPSTVTITPAPHIATTPVATTTLNNLNGKKHINTGTNLIALNSATGLASNGTLNNNMHGTLNNHNQHSHLPNSVGNINGNNNNTLVATTHHLNGINNNVTASLNQKIILVKATTSTKYSNNNTNNNNNNNAIINHQITTIGGGASTITAINNYNQNICKK